MELARWGVWAKGAEGEAIFVTFAAPNRYEDVAL